MNFHFYSVIFSDMFFESIWNFDPLMVQILWLDMFLLLCSCRFWIQILKMLNKSLLHIILNKWTFINLMSNLMVVCATRRIRSWNVFHTMNSSTPILWNSSNNASILLMKLGSLYLILTTTGRLSPTIGFAFGKTIVSCLVTSTNSTPLNSLIP